MTAEALLKRQNGVVYSVTEDLSIYDCIEEMNEKHVGALVVMNAENTLCGLVSERDILKSVYTHEGKIKEVPVKDVMTPEYKLIGIQKDEHVAKAMDKMTVNNIRHILIFDKESFKGLASIKDVVQLLLDNALLENKQLMDYVYQSY